MKVIVIARFDTEYYKSGCKYWVFNEKMKLLLEQDIKTPNCYDWLDSDEVKPYQSRLIKKDLKERMPKAQYNKINYIW